MARSRLVTLLITALTVSATAARLSSAEDFVATTCSVALDTISRCSASLPADQLAASCCTSHEVLTNFNCFWWVYSSTPVLPTSLRPHIFNCLFCSRLLALSGAPNMKLPLTNCCVMQQPSLQGAGSRHADSRCETSSVAVSWQRSHQRTHLLQCQKPARYATQLSYTTDIIGMVFVIVDFSSIVIQVSIRSAMSACHAVS